MMLFNTTRRICFRCFSQTQKKRRGNNNTYLDTCCVIIFDGVDDAPYIRKIHISRLNMQKHTTCDKQVSLMFLPWGNFHALIN
jgi:hypothetical protein